MIENAHTRWLLGGFAVLGFVCGACWACGPSIDDEEEHAAADGQHADDDACHDGSCPLACGDRTCVGALGIGRCIDDACSPVPMQCVIESSPATSCTEVCAGAGEGVVCMEKGCEGATAFGYPGTELEALSVCGESTPDVIDAVVPIEIACDAPLPFSGEGSFELYQCCCDHPDY